MRHRVGYRKLGRVTPHRIALLRNLATALFERERIRTTLMKAKELRPYAEKLITLAKRDENRLHSRRLVARDIKSPVVIKKLFDDLGARFAARPGGYTRILRLGFRRGDAAEVAQIELVGSEFNPNAEAEKAAAEAAKPKAKGVGGRLRAAAERLRGKPQAEGEEAEGAETPTKKAKPARPERGKGGKADTRGKGAKTTTPRKAGGS